jgi:eukaryotic-like serine/threonine-protein kinase
VSIAGPPLSAVRTCLARYCIAKQLRRGYYTEQQTSQKDVDGFRHPNCDGGMITEARAFGRYELRGLLGQGGFATVYRAYDPLLAREVALKALLPHLAADAGVRARFLAEARALAGLRHSNVVTVFDVGEAAGQPFFAMELVAGETLAARLEGGPPPHAATLAWLAEIASALDYLHAAGLVHRDVKPANVVIETSGRAVLMDLGIARSIDSTSHTLTGASLGTPAYMSPEQVRGETAGPPADIYALGVVAFQLLTGQPPFAGDTAHVLHAQVYDAPPLERLPPRSAAILATALAKEPAARWPSATAFVAALDGAEQSAPTLIDADSTRWYTPTAASPTPPTLLAQPENAAAGGFAPWHTPTPMRRTRVGGNAWALGGGLLAVLLLCAVSAAAVVLARGHAGNAGSHAANDNIGQASANVSSQATVAASALPSTTAATPAATSASATAAATATASATAVATAAAITDSATATRTPASATAPPPSVILPSDVTALTTDSSAVQAWASGQTALNVTVSFTNAPVGATLVVRVSPAAALDQPVGQSEPIALDASDGDTLAAVMHLSQDALPAGNYLLLAYVYGRDGRWVQQARTRGLAVAPPSAPPASVPAQPSSPVGAPAAPNLAYPATSVDGSRLWISAVQAQAAAGGNLSFLLTVRNDGAATGLGSISVSSPDAVQITGSPSNCDAAGQNPQSFQPGARGTVFHGPYGALSSATLGYPLGELDFSGLPAGALCAVRFTVVAQPSTSVLRLYLRVSTLDAGGIVATWPANAAQVDQQGYPVIAWTVAAR